MISWAVFFPPSVSLSPTMTLALMWTWNSVTSSNHDQTLTRMTQSALLFPFQCHSQHLSMNDPVAHYVQMPTVVLGNMSSECSKRGNELTSYDNDFLSNASAMLKKTGVRYMSHGFGGCIGEQGCETGRNKVVFRLFLYTAEVRNWRFHMACFTRAQIFLFHKEPHISIELVNCVVIVPLEYPSILDTFSSI